MNYTLENQLAEMLKEFQSRSQAKAALVLGLYVLILLLLFLTLLVMLLNRRMRTKKGIILSVKLKTYINCILLTGFSTQKIISFSKSQPRFLKILQISASLIL